MLGPPTQNHRPTPRQGIRGCAKVRGKCIDFSAIETATSAIGYSHDNLLCSKVLLTLGNMATKFPGSTQLQLFAP